MELTNFQKWQRLTDPLPSPQNYIDWSFLYLISASLQRRVWCPPEWRPLFSNMYITFVGPPGVGKTQPIRSVAEILSALKVQEVKPATKAINPEDQKIVDAMLALNDKEMEKSGESKPLIPVAADAVTYEALVKQMTESIGRINYYAKNEKTGNNDMRIYTHSSLCFCLEEIASLFRKHTESLVNFLIQAYDCGENYEYVTKTQGKDRIRRLCLNFLGATTPDFMQETFDDKLLSQGYSSRTFYAYAARNRKSIFFLKELTEEQKQYKLDLIEHVRKLSGLYGQVYIDPETRDFLETWSRERQANPSLRASMSSKLDAYYSRENIHAMKVAMAKHFGESTDMHIPLGTFKWAIDFLHNEEKTMHLALVFEGSNPLAKVSKKMVSYLGTGAKTALDMLTELWDILPNKESINEAIEYLTLTNMIESFVQEDEHTKEKIRYYRLKK